MTKELLIEYINNKNLSCLERPVVTVLNWLNVDYRYIFISSWTFSYNYMERYKGIQNVPELRSLLKNSKRYTGVCFVFKKLNVNKRISKICYEIEQGRPVIVYIDSFWCPWYPSYKKSHIHHYVLIIGINAEENYFICLDKHDLHKKVLLSFDDYLKGSGEIVLLSNKRIEKLRNNKVKTDCYKSLRPRIIQKNIQKFSDHVMHNVNMTEYVKGYHDVKVTPLYTWLKGIANDRLNFASSMEIFLDNSICSYYKNRLKEISDSWQSIIILLIKVVIKKETESVYKFIAKKIEQISEM